MKEKIRCAFAVEQEQPFSNDEIALLNRVVEYLVKRGLCTPALLFLQTIVPLNYIGAQLLTFFKPFASALFDPVAFEKFTLLLERRDTLPKLIELFEEKMRHKSDKTSSTNSNTNTKETSKQKVEGNEKKTD
ncbi:MAG: hypothetical protein N2234_01730 [Planctomycetota bacterium]|nr:hypothetical protein [Planctomycetota bacterium]